MKLKFNNLSPSAAIVAEMSGVSIEHDGKVVCRGFGLDVKTGERVCLSGRAGTGKSSLIRVFAGEIPSLGSVRFAGGTILSYIPQDTSFLSGSIESLAAESGIAREDLSRIFKTLGLEQYILKKNLHSLSEAQRKKVLLARSLAMPAHLYLWDEPLDYVDDFSRAQIVDAILDCMPTMVFVEDDTGFSERIATRTIRIGVKPGSLPSSWAV
ncbi:MAG: ATP-binding cassette domain-containing protein [Clostridiales Family XIII bacterium]|jgi:lincosamide and streptogramin A transport system ATP-binding/permease protein|nr:ATP-binding cassette domain-containing protein [Clostridiales Family XIII bacterium]